MIKWLSGLFSDMRRKDGERRMPDGEPVYEYEFPLGVSVSITPGPCPMPPLRGPDKNSSHFIVRTNRYDKRGEELLLKLLYNNWEILTATSFENQAVEYVLRNTKHVKPRVQGPMGLVEDSASYCDVKELVDFIVNKGTAETSSGQFILCYNELAESISKEQFKTILPSLIDELKTRNEVAEVFDVGGVADIQFYGEYCPNYVKLEGEK